MPIKKINAETLKKWIDSGEAVILDVREPAEHRTQKIKGAHNISYTKLTHQNLPEVKDNKLVLHCQSGRRSTIACENLLKENPSMEVYELEGGISSWIANNFDTESSGSNVMSIDRQVQVAIGSLLILFGLLTIVINSSFVYVMIAIGCGLLFAGLSGTCMLALLIAKMPWNK